MRGGVELATNAPCPLAWRRQLPATGCTSTSTAHCRA